MRYIAALDVGTTTVRCFILDESARVISSAIDKVELIYPKSGYEEIDPDVLWSKIVGVIKRSVNESNIDVKTIICLGISTQRASFTTWNAQTGRHYHRFITWKDLRADTLVKEWNSSLTMKSLRFGSQCLYTLSRNKRFMAGSIFKFSNTQMTLRLLWAIQNIPGLREASADGKVVFGGVDSWILYKLTGKHIMDISSASATGLFDPFTMQWAGWAINLLKLPRTIFPEVVDTAGNFGVTPAYLFGREIPIACSMADQTASLFGSGCFAPGDMKLTMGTGTFMDVNTGLEPHASLTGLYPLVGWRIGSEISYVVEGASNDTGVIIEWAKSIGIVEHASETSDLANTVNDANGVYFVPAFSGLQAPINDETAAAGFLGIKPTTERAHLVRSLLESIVFRTVLLYESLSKETRFVYHRIRVDGGVSNNDFVMQLLADLTGLEVERPECIEMSILGVAFVAGLQFGIWNNKDDLKKIRSIGKIFKPNIETGKNYQKVINQWRRAVDRFKDWY